MGIFRAIKKIFYILVFISFISLSCEKEEQITKVLLDEVGSAVKSQEEKEGPPEMDLVLVEAAFVKAARSAMPAVVNISTTQAVKNSEVNKKKGSGNFFYDLFTFSPFGKLPDIEYEEKSLGSGFIVKSDGYILTNNHVIAESDKIIVRLADKREFEGKVTGKDTKTDLAVLKISSEERFPTLSFGDSNKLEAGEWAIAIGNPFGLDRTVTFGVISATGRSNLGLIDNEDYIQTDASINFGNSGGPLLNIKGEVIGINTAIISSGQGIGFATPINSARVFLERLVFNGKIKKGWIGIGIKSISFDAVGTGYQIKRTGLLVKGVLDDSPAQKAGIMAGDIIVGLNKNRLSSINQFKNIVEGYAIGEPMNLDLIRNKEVRDIKVTIGEAGSDGIFE
ncbi:MAG TPA: trypsin-like peptidase domain-containing protein [Nitrospiria bacterium]|nr:trypsin-like peptidase domain-containing protein [Nitrospiria bacterium]